MGTLRVTQRLLVDRVLENIEYQQSRILDLQTQLATSRRVNAPSDDPIDARRAVNTQNLITLNEQYITNISRTDAYLSETDSVIQTVIEYTQRARELTIQGANGTYSQEQLDNIAEEVNQILEGVVNSANHQTSGRYIFAGTRTLSEAYEVTRNVDGDITAVTYQGNSEYIETSIGTGVTINVNEPGDAVFTSNQDLFQTLIDIRDNLLSGDQNSLQNARLEELEEIQDQLGRALARVGATQNRAESTSLELEDYNIRLRELLSDAVDADFAEVTVNLTAQSNAFSAALSAASQVIQPTLLNFL